jgi:hypothetical protein
MERTSVFDEVLTAPCAHEQCLICPSMRQHPDFAYPELHLLSLAPVERRARLHVDGVFRMEVDLRARSSRLRARRARRFLKGVLARAQEGVERAHLDDQARDTHWAVKGALIELEAAP